MKVIIISKIVLSIMAIFVFNYSSQQPIQGKVVSKVYVPASFVEINSYSILLDAPIKEKYKTSEVYILNIDVNGEIIKYRVFRKEFDLYEKDDIFIKEYWPCCTSK